MAEDAAWVDRFMQQILARDYDAAREILRSAVARSVSHRLAEQYGKVLEDFLRARDQLENPVVLGRFGSCILRQIDSQTGRGLAVPGYVPGDTELWKERPLMYIQSPSSRQGAQVCCACLAPLGSLASQLQHMGLSAPAGAEAVVLAPVVPCGGEGCNEVFCSDACRSWALRASAHAFLCNGRLVPAQAAALRGIERLALERGQEHLLLLAHGVACMVLSLREGQPLDEVLRRFAGQFASSPWDALVEGDKCTDSEDTAEVRRELFTSTMRLLRELFEGEERAAPLLDQELLSNLLGTFELVNLCISLPHPLNSRGEELCGLLDPATLARIVEVQRGVDDDSSSEEGDEEDGEEQEESVESKEASAVEAARKGTLFANVVGTSLCEALSFTNHSCLPNCRIDFATAGAPEALGPGLWVYGVSRRPLIPGDEVLMAYVPSVVGKPLAVRQRRMLRFGFACRCRSCVTDEMLAKEGDVL